MFHLLYIVVVDTGERKLGAYVYFRLLARKSLVGTKSICGDFSQIHCQTIVSQATIILEACHVCS